MGIYNSSTYYRLYQPGSISIKYNNKNTEIYMGSLFSDGKIMLDDGSIAYCLTDMIKYNKARLEINRIDTSNISNILNNLYFNDIKYESIRYQINPNVLGYKRLKLIWDLIYR